MGDSFLSVSQAHPQVKEAATETIPGFEVTELPGRGQPVGGGLAVCPDTEYRYDLIAPEKVAEKTAEVDDQSINLGLGLTALDDLPGAGTVHTLESREVAE
jgi:hypothetical protein